MREPTFADEIPSPAADAVGVSNSNSDSSNNGKRVNWCKVFLGCVLVCVAVYVLVDTLTTKNIESAFFIFLEWVKEHPVEGVLAVMLVQILGTIFFIPGWIMTIGAGYAFASAYGIKLGVLLATTAIFLGSAIGSVLSFLLGRYVFSEWIARVSHQYTVFRAINQALEHHGLKINILLRLSIIIPYNILDYLMGITTVSFLIYAVSLIALLPGTIIYTFLGATASSLTEATTTSRTEIAALSIGVVFALVAIGAASYYSKVELDKILAEDGRERNPRGGMAAAAAAGDDGQPIVSDVV